YMTYRNMTILNTSYAEAAECYVSQNYPKAGSKFVDCAMKTFNISDRNQLIPGNAAINCRGGVPPVYNGAQTTTSAKWAAVA
ncbi:hypothetical protein Q0P39_14395, partial [Staphylococcus aureus]|nr:hypothetical protein [Staphylococcus aureus]